MKPYALLLGLVSLGLAFPGAGAQTVTCALAADTMYRALNSSAVYYITADCKKQVVKSPEVFFSHATSWSEVKKANSITLGAIPDHEFRSLPWGPRREFLGGSLIKAPTDPRVFLVSKYGSSGQAAQTTLIAFDSEAAFYNNGFKWGWVEDVTPNVITDYPVSTNKITANWDAYPPGILYKLASSPNLYLTRLDPSLWPYREYLSTLQDVKNRRYRFDQIPTFSTSRFFLADRPDAVQPSPGTGTGGAVGSEDSAICADRNTVVSGAIVLCKGTSVRINSFMTAKVVAVTANDVVVSLVKDKGSSQTWTILVGNSKSTTFSEDQANTFSITYEKYGTDAKTKKPLAYLTLNTTASPQSSSPVVSGENCGNRTGGDGSYKVCLNNTIQHTGNFVAFKVMGYTTDTIDLAYTARRSDSQFTSTGNLSVRRSQVGYLSLPWASRLVQFAYLGKGSGNWAELNLRTILDFDPLSTCQSRSAGDGEYKLCLDQTLQHSSGVSFTAKSLNSGSVRLAINTVWEVNNTADPRMWDLGPGQSVTLHPISWNGAPDRAFKLTIMATDSASVTLKVQTL